MRNELHSPEYAAVLQVLSSPSIEARTAPYVRQGGVDWEGLLSEAESMSGGERVLVRIAYDLWEAEGVVGVWELPRRLDRGNFERVVEALSIYRDGSPGLGSAVLPDAA